MTKEQPSRPPGTKAVRVDVPEAAHAKLRVLAAENGKPMSVFVLDMVLQRIIERFPEVQKQLAAEPEQPKRPRGRPRKGK